MKLQAIPKNDRLKRWMILDMSGKGRGKTIIADNIRHEHQAKLLADSPGLLGEFQSLNLTVSEIKYITESIDGLKLIADYHDTQIVQGEAMGFSVLFHEDRVKELSIQISEMEDDL